MKTKKFKTIANDGKIVNVYVIILPRDEYKEIGVGIVTKRLISEEEVDKYMELNNNFPMFLPQKQFKDKILITTMSAPIKFSTFSLIYEFINQEQ